MFTSHTTNAAYNDGFESYDFDALLDKCATSLIFDERQEAIRELGDWYWERYIIAPVAINNRVFALSEKIKNIPLVIQPMSWEWRFHEYATHAD